MEVDVKQVRLRKDGETTILSNMWEHTTNLFTDVSVKQTRREFNQMIKDYKNQGYEVQVLENLKVGEYIDRYGNKQKLWGV